MNKNEYNFDKSDMDYLTGLPGRSGIYHYYSELNDDDVLHAMFVDIDNFKRINDTYGHSMGDRLLVSVSRHIMQFSLGYVFRIGGDEFVILIDGNEVSSKEEVEQMAVSIIEGMENIDFRKDILSLISLSIGIVFDQRACQNLDDILNRCDAAMYQSKYNGKNRYTIYNSDDKSFEISRNIENEMEKALENGEFRLYLQPKVNMITSEISGAEGLSRWIHPRDGLRMPAVYIQLFEKNGFISSLDMFIFEEVCRTKAAWKGRTYENLPVSVNMSRLHLYDRRFSDKLCAIADKYGIPHNELEIEITESVFIKDTTELIAMTTKLQDCGFLVSIDDFGSGFSALNLLKDLPVDTVKLDKGFLHNSSNTSRGRQVIRSVIAMCRDLKIQVVTEGIETAEQVDFITKCSCQTAQGFYYSQPVPVGEFEVFAEKHKENIRRCYLFRLDPSSCVPVQNVNDGKGASTFSPGLGTYVSTVAEKAFLSEDGSLKAVYVGGTPSFTQGIFSDREAIMFPGGDVEQNVIEVSPNAIVNDSYTISFWCKPAELHNWSSIFYMKFETGFSSFSPIAWEGEADFRIRDSREVNGWYDSSVCVLSEDLWWHVVISYNAQTEMAVAFINGEPITRNGNVPANRFVKRIMLGGDVFQRSYIGALCEVLFYNEAKDYDFVKELHLNYINDPKYIGGKLKQLI